MRPAHTFYQKRRQAATVKQHPEYYLRKERNMNITTTIPTKYWLRINERCVELRISMSQYVRDVVLAHFEKETGDESTPKGK